MRSAFITALVATAVLAFPGASPAGGSPDMDLLMARVEAAWRGVNDYRCTLATRELVKERVLTDDGIVLKYRKPASFYLGWTRGRNEGLEIIYVEGWNGNKLRVHPKGLLGFMSLSLDPHGSRAMRNNRHPVTEVGPGRIVTLLSENYRRGRGDPGAFFTVRQETDPLHGGVLAVGADLPPDRGYYAQRLRILLDAEMHLPVAFNAHGWRGEFLEEYRFEKLEVNVGLTDVDFDPANPAYRY
jgi:hypothetical protein